MSGDATKRYWDERAREHAGNPSATTNDIHLRRLEAKTLTESIERLHLRPGARVLDAGCGDGATTLALAVAFPQLAFTGIDSSAAMIGSARSATADDLRSRVTFEVGDILDLDAVCPVEMFDAALTVRCLINLGTLDDQARGIEELAKRLSPGSTYIAVENFFEGQHALNAARSELGLGAIEVRWHNRFFTEQEFDEICKPFFQQIDVIDFASSYYLATRVLYSALCLEAGVDPDYDHPIHRLAVDLPAAGRFSPVRKIEVRGRR